MHRFGLLDQERGSHLKGSMTREYDLIIAGSLEWQLSKLFFSDALLSDPYKLMFLSCHIRVSEWIYTLWLPECQGTPCSKQVQNQILIKFLWIHEIFQIANPLVEQNFIFVTCLIKTCRNLLKCWSFIGSYALHLLRHFCAHFARIFTIVIIIVIIIIITIIIYCYYYYHYYYCYYYYYYYYYYYFGRVIQTWYTDIMIQMQNTFEKFVLR